MKSFSKIALLLTIFLTLATVTGVMATFDYALYAPPTLYKGFNMQVGVFTWIGLEELPDDSNAGENHIALIERIINSSEGLNTPSSHLNDVINQRIQLSKETASSVAPTKGGNLKSLFNTDEMRELHFLLHFNPDENGNVTEYYLYTFERSILGYQQRIVISPVYKTWVTLREDGKWKAMRSWEGSAETIFYDTKQGSGKDMTINPLTWVEKQKPTVTEN